MPAIRCASAAGANPCHRAVTNHLGDGVRVGDIEQAERTGRRPFSGLTDVGGEHHVVALLDQLAGPGLVQVLVLLLVSGVLGFLGAWISVQRYLRMLRVGGTLGRR